MFANAGKVTRAGALSPTKSYALHIHDMYILTIALLFKTPEWWHGEPV